DFLGTGVQTCALPISVGSCRSSRILLSSDPGALLAGAPPACGADCILAAALSTSRCRGLPDPGGGGGDRRAGAGCFASFPSVPTARTSVGARSGRGWR